MSQKHLLNKIEEVYHEDKPQINIPSSKEIAKIEQKIINHRKLNSRERDIVDKIKKYYEDKHETSDTKGNSEKKQNQNNNSKVYLMRCSKYYKIGKSTNPIQRLNNLQTGNPKSIYLVGEISLPDLPNKLKNKYGIKNISALEQWLHNRFSNSRIRCNGEWFLFNKETEQYVRNIFNKTNQENDILSTLRKSQYNDSNKIKKYSKVIERKSDFFQIDNQKLKMNIGKHDGEEVLYVQNINPTYFKYIIKQGAKAIDKFIAQMALNNRDMQGIIKGLKLWEDIIGRLVACRD